MEDEAQWRIKAHESLERYRMAADLDEDKIRYVLADALNISSEEAVIDRFDWWTCRRVVETFNEKVKWINETAHLLEGEDNGRD